jgi:hypothetical protein
MQAIFARQMATDEARSDLALAQTIAAEAPACLLCFERDPEGCHRLAVAEAMGLPVSHLFCDLPDLGGAKLAVAPRRRVSARPPSL